MKKYFLALLFVILPFISVATDGDRSRKTQIRLCLDDLMKEYPRAFQYAELNHMLMEGNLSLSDVVAEENLEANRLLLEKISSFAWVDLSE